MSTTLATPWKGTRRLMLAKPGKEREVLKLLADRNDPAKRQTAIRLFNRFSGRFGDLAVRLSSQSLFPDTKTQGVPAAVEFGETDRRMVDMRWTQLFNVQDRRTQNNPYFKIVDLYNAVEFRIYQLGERIEVRHIEADEAIFQADVIAGGLQWNQLWSMWQDLWDVNQGLAGMQAKYADDQAEAAYDTLTASGLSTTAYDTTGGTQLEKDVNTINQAIVDLGNAIYQNTSPSGDQTEEDISGATFFLLYNPSVAGYRKRVNRALEARFDLPNDSNSASEVQYPVVPLDSRKVPTGAWYLVLPGRKNIAAIFKDLTIYDMNDPRIAGVAEGRIGQGAYKMVRGDSNQVRKAATS